MQFVKYIEDLRSALEALVASENAMQNPQLLSQARDAIDKTADYQVYAVDRNTLIEHIQWLDENFEGEAEAKVVKILRQLLGVKRHELTDVDGDLYLHDSLLFCHGLESDLLTINSQKPHAPTLLAALYDAYQRNGTIRTGDDFVLNGQVIAKCVGMDVVSTEGSCSVILTNYNWDEEQLAEICEKYQVAVVDDSFAPHFVVYKGKRANLAKLIHENWQEHFDSDYEMHEEINNHPFLCTWGEGYINQTMQLKGASFFVDANGYTEADVSRILSLKSGASIELLESGYHMIKRLY